MDDELKPYEVGLTRLLELTGKGHQDYLEVLVFQARLLENIKRARMYGDTDSRGANRAEIIDNLNRLALTATGQSFNKLCGLDNPPSMQKSQTKSSVESLSLARDYIVKVQNSLRYTYKLFSNVEDIWPSQCERATEALQKIGKPIPPTNGSNLLLNGSNLLLMVELYRIDKYVNELIQLVKDFRRICRKSSSRTLKMREKIDRQLDSIIQSLSVVNILIDSIGELVIQPKVEVQIVDAHLNEPQTDHSISSDSTESSNSSGETA